MAFTRKDGVSVRAFDPVSMNKVKKDFAVDAAFMQKAGFNGVFIHGGHGWMMRQFLSPLSNKRDDAFGGKH